MRSQRDGMVLLVVVVIIMLLSVAAYEYVFSTQTEHMAAALDGDRLRSQQSALSARDLLSVLLQQPRAERDLLGGLEDNPTYFSGDPAALHGTRQSSPLSSPNDDDAPHLGLIAHAEWSHVANRGIASTGTGESASRPQPASETRYGAINESSKIHLAKLLELDAQNPGYARTALLQIPGLDPNIADALLDWVDSDDTPRPLGAESEFYAQLAQPLAPRQGLPPDLEELLFVRGITAGLLFGGPDGRVTTIAAPPSQALSTPSATPREHDAAERPWQHYLTVYSAERNETYAGAPRIFVNQSDLGELRQQLVAAMDPSWADFILLVRQYGASEGAGESISTDIPPADLSVPAQFELQNLMDLVGAVVLITQDEEVKAVQSPFRRDRSSMQSQLPALLDTVTLVPERRIVGRVNVNVALPEVLSMLPGLTPDLVRAIVAARASTSVEEVSRYHPIWLLTEGHVDFETMRLILPHITCGGDVYRAHLWGFIDHQSPIVHMETVLDVSQDSVRQVYYRELPAPRDAIQLPSLDRTNPLESGQPRNPTRAASRADVELAKPRGSKHLD